MRARNLLCLVTVLTLQVAPSALAESHAEQVKADLRDSTAASAGLLIVGGAMVFSGVGTVPGIILMAKGGADLLVDLKNIFNFAAYDETPIAYTAIGSAVAGGALALGQVSEREARDLARRVDRLDSVGTILIGAGAGSWGLMKVASSPQAVSVTRVKEIAGAAASIAAMPVAAEKAESDRNGVRRAY